MKRTFLIRWGGLAAIVGGVLFLAFPLLGYARVSVPFFGGMVGGLLLTCVGMVGFHALQSQRYGRVGVAGFWLVVVASLVVAFGVADYFIWGDFLQQAPPAWLGWGLLVLVVGFVLFGSATLRARVLPRWCGVVFIVATPAALASSTVGAFAAVFVVFGLAWLALGYALWRRREAPTVQQPRRAR